MIMYVNAERERRRVCPVGFGEWVMSRDISHIVPKSNSKVPEKRNQIFHLGRGTATFRKSASVASSEEGGMESKVKKGLKGARKSLRSGVKTKSVAEMMRIPIGIKVKRRSRRQGEKVSYGW
jgi:hypothetical protein